MGTDITIYFEAYNADTKAWVSTDKWGDVHGDWNVPYDDRIYTGRNYRLFAMLAGERNDFNITPFADHRGLPKDTDKRITKAISDYEPERSSHFTLEELLSFDWSQPIAVHAFVGLSDWERWQERLKFDKRCYPASWCAGTNGEIISEDAARKLITKLKSERGGIEQMETNHWRTYVECQWTRTFYNAVSEFWGSVIPHMYGLGKPEFVRMVFCFG